MAAKGRGAPLLASAVPQHLVHGTHASLEAERQKALLLVRNFAPNLADDLLLEFGEE